MIVYKVTNTINGMCYIGITTRQMSHRKYNHKRTYRNGVGTKNTIYQAYRDYGWENFSWEGLEKVSSVEELRSREIYWIEKLKTLWPNGYNQNRGGSCTPANERNRKFIVEGKAYYGFGQLADAYNLNQITVTARINRQGWTVRQAVGLDPKPKHTRPDTAKPITFNGVEYKSERELCQKYKVCNNVFRQRYHRMGWSLEESLGVKERKKSRHEISVLGKTFRSRTAAAKYYGLKQSTVTSRLNYGYSLEEALTMALIPNTAERYAK